MAGHWWDPLAHTDEKETLHGWLQGMRHEVVSTLEGLSEEHVRWSPVPSGTSLGGIVKHLIVVEHNWFQVVLNNQERHRIPGDQEWRLADDETADDAISRYQDEASRSDQVISGTSLEATAANPAVDRSLRWILVHMVEETARHAGHADIIRELIDGRTST